jgi:hypothetical protein
MTQSTQDILKNILNNYGMTICSESKRLQGILQDRTSESKGKIKALVLVAEENVVNELFKSTYHQVYIRGQFPTALTQWGTDPFFLFFFNEPSQ